MTVVTLALNAERAAEEARGQVRWEQPEFQARSEGGDQRSEVGGQRAEEQTELQLPAQKTRSVRPVSGRRPWPAEIPEQVQALRVALEGASGPVDAAFLAGRFTRANAERVAALLETLVIAGQARKLPDGRYSGRV